MGRTEIDAKIRERLSPTRDWLAALVAAWERLSERGQRKKVYEAAQIGKATAYRIVAGDVDNISGDTIERLRVAINDELGGGEEEDGVIPPFMVRVRSRGHFAALRAVDESHQRGDLDPLLEWLEAGRKLSATGSLAPLLEIVRRRIAVDTDLSQSGESVSSPLPAEVPERRRTVTPRSGTKADGRGVRR